VKLLFDENLSPKLLRLLAALFAGSTHVRECGLLGRMDEEIWNYARANNFTVVSKDSDFQQRSLLYGHPPKLVWLRVGNCTREQLFNLIAIHEQDIQELGINLFEAILVLS
jgi:predicted nuclease of predicted toxin-antitoxin system